MARETALFWEVDARIQYVLHTVCLDSLVEQVGFPANIGLFLQTSLHLT